MTSTAIVRTTIRDNSAPVKRMPIMLWVTYDDACVTWDDMIETIDWTPVIEIDGDQYDILDRLTEREQESLEELAISEIREIYQR